LFNICRNDAGYLTRILFCLIFLIVQHSAYALPPDTSGAKSLFEGLKNVPANKRVAEAGMMYKYKPGLRKAAPGAAMAGLDQLNRLAQALKDKSLECAVFEMRADYYSVNKGFNDLSIFWYQKAVDFATANHMPAETGLYLHKTGTYYATFKHNALACRYFLLSQEIFNQVGYAKIPDICYYLSQVADFYYSLGDYENAKANLEAALHYLPENKHDRINLLNTIGLIHRSYGEFPGAMDYFNKALKLAAAQKDTVWVGIAKGNIGSVYFLQGEYQKALPLVDTDYKISMKYGEPQNGVIALLRLIKINIDNRNFESAGQQLKSAESILRKTNVLSSWADYYDLRSQLLERLGQSAESMADRKIFERDKDSLAKRNNIAAVERVKLRYEIDKHNADVNKLKSDAEVQSVQIKAAAAVVILLMVISLLVYRNQRVKSKKDRELLIAEKRVVDEELKNAVSALNSFTASMRQKNILIENFKGEIERLKLQSEYNSDAGHLEKLMQAHIMTEESWHDFKKMFSKVYPGFFVSLSEKYPLLSSTDTRILTLIKLGLNNSEMANMLGITIEGIQKAKQRLRKKLDVTTLSDVGHDIAVQ